MLSLDSLPTGAAVCWNLPQTHCGRDAEYMKKSAIDAVNINMLQISYTGVVTDGCLEFAPMDTIVREGQK